jgi:predicted nucleic acid-binding protein
MILFDTNVIIDIFDETQTHHQWAIQQVVSAVLDEGAVVSAVTVAELCAGDRHPDEVNSDLANWGVRAVDIPAGSAAVCGKAYRRYVTARRVSGGGAPPKMPLPDFFIGAQAEVMGWKIATRDAERFKKYFSKVPLLTP